MSKQKNIAKQQIIKPLNDPIKDSHLVVYKPCPEGAVAKISGKEGLKFEGKAIVFNSEENNGAILGGKVRTCCCNKYEDKGGPGIEDARTKVQLWVKA